MCYDSIKQVTGEVWRQEENKVMMTRNFYDSAFNAYAVDT